MLFIAKSNSFIRWLLLGLCALSGPAAALGFGEVRANALLGQPLNLALPVTLADGETLTSDCVSAEVQAGDSRLLPGTVRARVTQGRDPSEAIVRIISTVAIDEPVVNVTVSAGCPTRVTRSLVVLADPPLVTVDTPATATAPAPAPAALPRTTAVASDSTPSSAPIAPAARPPRATRPATPPRAARAAVPRDTDAAPTTEAVPQPRSRPSTARAAPARAPEPEGRPRLQLDGAQVATASPAVAEAEAQAASARAAASAAEAAASAAQQRLKDMETEVARLRADAKAQTEALIELRKQLAQDRNRGTEAGWLMPALIALAGLLGAIALWLAWRLKQQQQRQAILREAWHERAAPPSSIGPSINSMRRTDDEEEEDDSRTHSRIPSTLPPVLPVAAKPKAPPQPAPSMFDTRAGGLDSMISPPTMPAHTMVTLPVSGLRVDEDESARAVSVDEQIDLEQQADFFIALGHDESAIDLLMAHLRSTGGGTPLPFLKLLEIHRRRGDRDAYERTRVRFNQRFNSVAPDWQSDPKEGRSLEDYPLVVGRIQTAWPKPLDAMAEIEALLFRRGVGSEMFELPAYQEVLFLYQLARDLHQQSQPAEGSDVDVLLPISTDMAPLVDGAISLSPELGGTQGLSLDLELDATQGAQGDKPMLELDLGPDSEAGGAAKPDPKRLA
jgi:hypothetical protein